MRRLTLLWTMRRLWRDASVAASGLELSLERGRQARSNRAGAGGGKRARQVLLREGRGQEPHEVMSKFKVGDFDWPYCRAALRVVDDARVAGGIAADGRAALHVVDDARVAGGIAADGMNINARPRRRVAGQDTYCQRRILRHPMLSLYGTGVFSLSRKIFCQKIMRGRGDRRRQLHH